MSVQIDSEYISIWCDYVIPRFTEADMNQYGGDKPKCAHISIEKIMILANYLFITGPQNTTFRNCP